MKVFLTGATGFVGHHITEDLLKNGHTVYALARSEEKGQKLLKSFSQYLIKDADGEVENLKIVLGELNAYHHPEWIKKLPSDLDSVIHSAGVVSSKFQITFTLVNHQATIQLIEAFVNKYPKLHITFISSLAAAGPAETLEGKRISDPLTPVSSYGESKAHAERDIRKIIPNEYSYAVVRPPMVIGPRDPAVLDIYKLAKKRIITGPGKGFENKVYSVVNVFDLVEVINFVTSKNLNGTYYPTSHHKITFKELIEEISHIMEVKPITYLPIPIWFLRILAGILRPLPLKTPLTPDKINELTPNNWTCSNKEVLELGLTPKFDITETLNMAYQDYKQRGWL